jgi:hypothetical protein
LDLEGGHMARVFEGLGAWLVSPAAHRVAFALLVVLWPGGGNSMLIGCN